MSNKWPTVKVGDVLTLNTNRVSVDPSATYPMVGVLSFGRGLFDREPIVNGNTSYKFFYRLDSDHFVMSQLFGWEGALALSSEDYAGKYLSPQFPTFRCNSAKLDRKFLGWVTRRPDFWDQLGKKASGMGDRRRTLTPDALLTSEIPLPPLSEQQRIVDLIEAFAGRIDEARGLRGEADAGADDLMIAMAHRRDLPDDVKQARGWVRRKLGECMQLSEEPVKVAVSESYPNLGIYSFGRGLFAKAPINGFETSASRLFRVKTSQFIYSRLFAFEGAYGVVGDEFDGCFVSNEYPTFDCRPDVMRPEFLAAYIQTPTVWRAVATGSKGLGDRRQRVHPDQVLNHELWLPPLAYQDTLAKVSRQRVSSRLPADECSVAMDAVLPAVLDKAFRGEM